MHSTSGQWLLDCFDSRSWVNNAPEAGKKKILFLYGIPGAGKTMVACSVIDHLEQKFQGDNPTVISYIFCNYKTERSDLLSYYFASLLQSILRQLDHIPEPVRASYDRHVRQMTFPSARETDSLIEQILPSLKRWFLITDALDECSNEEHARVQLSEAIDDLQSRFEDRVYYLATSRPLPEIKEQFENVPSLEILAHEDVKICLDNQMTYLPSYIHKSPQLKEDICDAIIDAIDGIYAGSSTKRDCQVVYY